MRGASRSSEQQSQSGKRGWIVVIAIDVIQQAGKLRKRFTIETAEEIGWSPDDFRFVLSQLSDLARRADETGRTMYLWNSL